MLASCRCRWWENWGVLTDLVLEVTCDLHLHMRVHSHWWSHWLLSSCREWESIDGHFDDRAKLFKLGLVQRPCCMVMPFSICKFISIISYFLFGLDQAREWWAWSLVRKCLFLLCWEVLLHLMDAVALASVGQVQIIVDRWEVFALDAWRLLLM